MRIRFVCPFCCKRLKARSRWAGKRVACTRCQSVMVAPQATAPPPPSSPPPANRNNLRTFIAVVGLSMMGLALIAGLTSALEARRKAARVVIANQIVADLVDKAQDHVARNRWDQAAGLLLEALATERATDFRGADKLLARTRQAQATQLLALAEDAIKMDQVDLARQRLEQYLDMPETPENARARDLVAQLEWVSSTGKAVDLLHQWTGSQLVAFAERDVLPDPLLVAHPRLQEKFRTILRHQLPAELARREEVRKHQEQERLTLAEAEKKAREEEARQIQQAQLAERNRLKAERVERDARIRQTPVYQELREFVIRTGQRVRERRQTIEGDQRKFLAALLDGIKTNEAQEKTKALTQLLSRLQRETRDQPKGLDLEAIEDHIASKRAQAKERFRLYKNFNESDWGEFDRAVDQELETLVKEIHAPADDDLAAGLRALAAN